MSEPIQKEHFNIGYPVYEHFILRISSNELVGSNHQIESLNLRIFDRDARRSGSIILFHN